MNEATRRFFGKFYLGQTVSADYADWAVACLEDGFDSKNLRMLAAMDKSDYPSEIEDRLHRSLQELGWSYPNKEESLLSYAKDIAGKIISGEFNTSEGLKKIYEVYRELDYPERLSDWLWLSEGYNPETMEWLVDSTQHYPLNEMDKLSQAIIREAKKLVESDY